MSSILFKTKLCSSYKVGCKRKKCTFAHSVDEINVVNCKFGNMCINEKCLFYHPFQPYPTTEEIIAKASEGVIFVEKRETFIVDFEDIDDDFEEDDDIDIDRKRIINQKADSWEELVAIMKSDEKKSEDREINISMTVNDEQLFQVLSMLKNLGIKSNFLN